MTGLEDHLIHNRGFGNISREEDLLQCPPQSNHVISLSLSGSSQVSLKPPQEIQIINLPTTPGAQQFLGSMMIKESLVSTGLSSLF